MPIVFADSISVDVVKSVIEVLPVSARSSQHTNSTSFHVLRLPPPAGNVDRLRRIVAEYCIQPLGSPHWQAIWWTSYIVLARRGTLNRGTGVYTEWNEFGTVSSQPEAGIIAPRNSGVVIVDINKGVLNGNNTKGAILQVVDLSQVSNDVEIYSLLAASGLHDGSYQIHGQARLEYQIRDN